MTIYKSYQTLYFEVTAAFLSFPLLLQTLGVWSNQGVLDQDITKYDVQMKLQTVTWITS